MIRVTVELVPHGIETAKRQIAVMEICNDGTGTKEAGSYYASLHAEYTSPSGRCGYVWGFRRQSQSVWSLIGAFLKLFGHTKHSPKLMGKSGGNEQPNCIDRDVDMRDICELLADQSPQRGQVPLLQGRLT